MSQTNTKWDKSGISITIEPKSKNKKLSAGSYKLVNLDDILASYLSAELIQLNSSGKKGIRVYNYGNVPTVSNTTTYSLLYYGYQSAPSQTTWQEATITVVDGAFSYIIENPLPLASYHIKLRLYDHGTTRDFQEITLTTPADTVYTDVETLKQDLIAVQQAVRDVTLTADGAIQSYWQTSPPAIPPASEGDLWFDTDDKNKLWVVKSGAWVVAQDQRIGEALDAASTAIGIADGKAKIWYQTSAPTGLTINDQGDLWVDTDDNLKVWAWSGSAWVVAQDWFTANQAAKKALEDLAIISDDGWLSKGEKPAVVTKFLAAKNEKAVLLGRAAVLGVPASDYSNAISALESYIQGLSPAYDDLTQDTAIDSATWINTWQAYELESTRLWSSLQSAVLKVDLAQTSNLTTYNSSATNPQRYIFNAGNTLTVDSVNVSDGQTLALVGVSMTASMVGIYRVSSSSSSSSARSAPNSVTLIGSGTLSNAASAYDNNTSTSATLHSPSSGTASALVGGFSGSGTSGTLNARVNWSFYNGDGIDSTGVVFYSVDGGTNWTQFPSGLFSPSYAGDRTVSIALSGVAQSNIRVRVDAVGIYHRQKLWDADLQRYYYEVTAASTTADIIEVWYDSSASVAGVTTLTKISEVFDGDNLLVGKGTSFGGKVGVVQKYGSIYNIFFKTPEYQPKLTAGANIAIAADGTISSSGSGGSSVWGSITGTAAQASPSGGWTGTATFFGYLDTQSSAVRVMPSGAFRGGIGTSEWGGAGAGGTSVYTYGSLYLHSGNSPTPAVTVAPGGDTTFSTSAQVVANDARFTVKGGGSTNGFLMGQDGSKNCYIWNYDNTPLYFGVNNATKFSLGADGAGNFYGNLTVNGTWTYLNNVNLSAAARINGASHFVLNPAGASALYLCYDSGTGGIQFGNGSGSTTGSISNTGDIVLNGSATFGNTASAVVFRATSTSASGQSFLCSTPGVGAQTGFAITIPGDAIGMSYCDASYSNPSVPWLAGGFNIYTANKPLQVGGTGGYTSIRYNGISFTDSSFGASSQTADIVFTSAGNNTLTIRTNYPSTDNKITLSPGQYNAVTVSGDRFTQFMGSSSASGLFVKSFANASHYNWKISTQDTATDAFEIAPSTTVGGTTWASPILRLDASTGSTYLEGGASMTSSWNRTLELSATFPSLSFNGSNSKWAGIMWDYSSGFYIRVASTSNDLTGSGVWAARFDQNTGAFTAYDSISVGASYSKSSYFNVITNAGYQVTNGGGLTAYWQGSSVATTLYTANPSSNTYEFGILNSAQTVWVMRSTANGSVLFGSNVSVVGNFSTTGSFSSRSLEATGYGTLGGAYLYSNEGTRYHLYIEGGILKIAVA